MKPLLTITADQDVALWITGPFVPPAEIIGDPEEWQLGEPTACHRGVFWLRPEEPPVLAIEVGFRQAELGYNGFSYIAPRDEAYMDLLDSVIMRDRPEDVLAHRIACLMDLWEEGIEKGEVPVHRVILFSELG